MSKHGLRILIVVLALVSISCGLIGRVTERLQDEYEKVDEVVVTVEEMVSEDSDTEEETDSETESSSAEDIPEQQPDAESSEDEAALPDIADDALSQLDSYRMRFEWSLEKADGSTESLTMEQAATRDPQAQQFLIGSAGESIEYIQIGDQVWIRYGDEWMQSSSDVTGDFAEEFGAGLMDESNWIDEVEDEDYEYLGREDINGIRARHYRATYNESWLGLLGEQGPDDIDQGTADVWIADDNDVPAFVVRFEVEIKGTADSESVTGRLSQEVYDVNATITIEPPADVALGGLPEGVPLYPEAEGLTTFGTMTTFTVGDDVETVNDFYAEALENAGWIEDEGSSMSTDMMATSTWTKDGETLTLNIVESEGDEGTQVVVTLGE